ncbi:hypothetical protein [Ancylomarina sp. 16SWW S1-10-2]|nr:hypothetical protein [Ancylomarina sp. 16SWW S1-10-2]
MSKRKDHIEIIINQRQLFFVLRLGLDADLNDLNKIDVPKLKS